MFGLGHGMPNQRPHLITPCTDQELNGMTGHICCGDLAESQQYAADTSRENPYREKLLSEPSTFVESPNGGNGLFPRYF